MPQEEREKLRSWIFSLEYEFYKIPRPDVNIYLNVPLDFIASRLASSRSEDSDRDYLNGQRDIHEEIAKSMTPAANVLSIPHQVTCFVLRK